MSSRFPKSASLAFVFLWRCSVWFSLMFLNINPAIPIIPSSARERGCRQTNIIKKVNRRAYRITLYLKLPKELRSRNIPKYYTT